MKLLTSIFLMLITAPIYAQPTEVKPQPVEAKPTIDVPATVPAKIGRAAVIEIKTTAKDLAWEVIAPPGAEFDAFREFTDAATFKLRVTAYNEGTYYLIVAGAAGDKVVEKKCVITVGESMGGPEAATVSATAFKKLQKDVAALQDDNAAMQKDIALIGSTLNKLIDTLNKKPPVGPPPPTDAFTKSLFDAYAVDPDPQKAAKLSALIDVYKAAQNIANDMSLKAYSEVDKAIETEHGKKLKMTDLRKIRDLIGAELNWAFGVNEVALTPKVRQVLTTNFARVQAALETLK